MITSVQEILRRKCFDSLLSDSWQEVILSLIREQEEHNAAVKRPPLSLPTWVKELPSLRVCIHVAGGSRMEFGEVVEVATILQEELSTHARKLFGEGLTNLVEKTHFRIRTYKSEGELLNTNKLLDRLVVVNGMFGGVINSLVAEKILFEYQKVPIKIRSMLAHDLVERDFSNSISPHSWDRLRKQVPQEPKLAGAVISWLTSDDRPEEALSVLSTFCPLEDDDLSFGGLDWTVREALHKALKAPKNPHFEEVLKELSEWAVRFIIDDGVLSMLSQREQKKVRALLSKS